MNDFGNFIEISSICKYRTDGYYEGTINRFLKNEITYHNNVILPIQKFNYIYKDLLSFGEDTSIMHSLLQLCSTSEIIHNVLLELSYDDFITLCEEIKANQYFIDSLKDFYVVFGLLHKLCNITKEELTLILENIFYMDYYFLSQIKNYINKEPFSEIVLLCAKSKFGVLNRKERRTHINEYKIVYNYIVQHNYNHIPDKVMAKFCKKIKIKKEV